MEHSVAINLEDLPKTRATGGELASAGSEAVVAAAAEAVVAAAAEAAMVVAEAGGDDASWRFGSPEFFAVGSC